MAGDSFNDTDAFIFVDLTANVCPIVIGGGPTCANVSNEQLVKIGDT